MQISIQWTPGTLKTLLKRWKVLATGSETPEAI